MKIFKYVLPWLMAAVLVLGSCMTVCAEDYTEEQLLEMRNETKAMFYQYFEDNDLSPAYMIYYLQYYGGNYSARVLYSDEVMYMSSDGQNVIGSFKELCYSYKNGVFQSPSSVYTTYSWKGGTYPYFITNYDLLYEDGETLYQAADTTGFFPKVPVLQKALKGTELTGVMKEILAMVPLLIPLLAGYLALRKALSLVSQTLKTA